MSRKRLIFVLFMLVSVQGFAQTEGRVSKAESTKESSFQLGIGGVNVLDTYLSPLEYTGTEARFISTTERHKGVWTRQMQHEAMFLAVENKHKTASEMGGMYRFRYGQLHDINIKVDRLALRAGGQATLNAGFLYNTRNENNPAQARLGLQIGPMAQAEYEFTLLKKPLRLRYEVALPLVGLMFSPNYGQSYYEIFTRGNYDHNCVPTTVFATPSLRHSLTLDFKLLKKTFSVGYLGDYDQYKVNNLKYHSYTHALVLGYRY